MLIDAPEARLWNALRVEPLKPLHFRRQVPFDLYYADFASHTAKLIIEVDGAQHFDNDARAYDAQRTAYLQSRGYRVLRVTTTDVLRNLDAVCRLIIETAALPTHQPPAGPPPPPRKPFVATSRPAAGRVEKSARGGGEDKWGSRRGSGQEIRGLGR